MSQSESLKPAMAIAEKIKASGQNCPEYGTNAGHGHVWRRPDGSIARCGVANGWPGFPERLVDLRSMPRLQGLGLVESGIHQFGVGRETRGGVWWRITEADRLAIQDGETR